MSIKIKKLRENATIPTRGHASDAGLDLYTIENGCIHGGEDGIVKTGIAIGIPTGYCGIVKEKSGRATKNKLTIGACVIDSGYRGELLIHIFNNDSVIPFTYGIGEKIAQLLVVPYHSGTPVEVDELDDTERGEGRFGSTGITYPIKIHPPEIGKMLPIALSEDTGVDMFVTRKPQRSISMVDENTVAGIEPIDGGIEIRDGCIQPTGHVSSDEIIANRTKLTLPEDPNYFYDKSKEISNGLLGKKMETKEQRDYWAGIEQVASKCPPGYKYSIDYGFYFDKDAYDEHMKTERRKTMKTEIVVILDRSGSMTTISEDAIGGYNEFIKAQKKVEGEAVVTLAQFDDEYELVYDGVPIEEVVDLNRETFVPRGMTALNDAIGKTIENVRKRQVHHCPVCDKYGEDTKTIVAILTDGGENSSREFTTQKINELISHQRNTHNWEFIFLAANQDAFATGGAFGIASADTFNFAHTGVGTKSAYLNMTNVTTSYRTGGSTNKK